MFGSRWGNNYYTTKGTKCFCCFSLSAIGKIYITNTSSHAP